MAPRDPVEPALRRFLLARRPDAGDPAELAEGEAEHARRVLRLASGDRLIGLDGEGGAWPLAVVAADRGRFEIAVAGEPRFEPAPGEPGAPLPWIELAVALPRGERAEQLVERATQLGAARLVPLVCERSTPEARAEGPGRARRLARIAVEACKQSGRLWRLAIADAGSCAQLLAQAGSAIVLDPRADAGLLELLAAEPLRSAAASATRAHPLRLLVGPEGGFAPAEERALEGAGAVRARLGPHILRIETAAEAALAVAVARLARR